MEKRFDYCNILFYKMTLYCWHTLRLIPAGVVTIKFGFVSHFPQPVEWYLNDLFIFGHCVMGKQGYTYQKFAEFLLDMGDKGIIHLYHAFYQESSPLTLEP